MQVLITGAAGLIGRQLTSALEREHALRLADLRPLPGDSRWVPLDVTRPEQVQAAMQGMDAVIHLAIASGFEGDYEDDAFNQLRFDVNVKGTHNVLQAAVRAGVRRFVHTSSLMVVWGYPPPTFVPSDAAARPVGTYAVTKYLGEVLCEQFSRQHGLSIACLRIPKPIDLDDPRWKQRRLRPQWLAFPDLVQAFQLALTAHDISFEIITIVGESAQRRWDLDKAERVLGFRQALSLLNLGYVIGGEDEPLTSSYTSSGPESLV